MNTLLGKKLSQSQMFLMDGTRIPVTHIQVNGNVVVRIKTEDKDQYSAMQIGFGIRKKPNKSLKNSPQYIKEVRIDTSDSSLTKGATINPADVFKPGDVIDVTGISKGKGYAGVVKRHHFKGGPRTHGQSDRERAPGSIGQTTTPGRVYKGKRMAGRMGHERVTIENLIVVDVTEDRIIVKGLVPGSINTFLTVKKVGEDRKFVPLYKEVSKGEEVSKVSKGEDVKIVTDEKKKGEENAK